MANKPQIPTKNSALIAVIADEVWNLAYFRFYVQRFAFIFVVVHIGKIEFFFDWVEGLCL